MFSQQTSQTNPPRQAEAGGVALKLNENNLTRKTEDSSTLNTSPSVRLLRVLGPGLSVAMEAR